MQLEAARLNALFAEHLGWTAADVAAAAAERRQAKGEMADQLVGWRDENRIRASRQHRGKHWN